MMVVAGNLTFKPLVIESGDMVVKSKSMMGFFLLTEMLANHEKTMQFVKLVGQDILKGGKTYLTKVRKIYPFEEWESAIPESKKHSSEGKTLLRL